MDHWSKCNLYDIWSYRTNPCLINNIYEYKLDVVWRTKQLRDFSLCLAIPAHTATIYYQNGEFVYKPGVVDTNKGVAYAQFKNGLLINGWGVLDVVSGYGSVKLGDNQTMYAAGFLEGALTYR